MDLKMQIYTRTHNCLHVPENLNRPGYPSTVLENCSFYIPSSSNDKVTPVKDHQPFHRDQYASGKHLLILMNR